MNFSYEEIYWMYGQYDNNFVELELHADSESFRVYSNKLMGSFIYTFEERTKIEEQLKREDIPRSNKHVKFKPSDLEFLSSEQIETLDKKGILCADISCVSTINLPRHNRFALKEEKEIPNTHTIQININENEFYLFQLGFYTSRIKNGYKLMPEEEYEFLGLSLFFCPELVKKQYSAQIYLADTKNINDKVLYYYLKFKFLKGEISTDEKNEFDRLFKIRAEKKLKILEAELKRTGENLKKIAKENKGSFCRLISICSSFEDEVILPYEFPVWWDLERFLHIYLRHVKETKVGESFNTKTNFQYRFRDIRRIVDLVLESIYPEIKLHFQNNPSKVFKRIGSRSVCYDGNYYRIEIEPNGRLLTFHPLNNYYEGGELT